MGEWGEASPADVFYQSLYPVDPNIVPQPDFHYLQAFQPIDLQSIGYEQSASMSDLWEEALYGRQYTFKYAICLPNRPTLLFS